MRPWLVFGLCACRAAPSPAVEAGALVDAAPTLEARAQRVMTALVAGDGEAFAQASGAEVRVEVRDLLVETDERAVETLVGRGPIAAFPSRFFSATRFPGGLSTAGALRCFPDCCDVQVGGVKPGVVQLRRLCFSARGPSGEPRLGYLVFVTAR